MHAIAPRLARFAAESCKAVRNRPSAMNLVDDAGHRVALALHTECLFVYTLNLAFLSVPFQVQKRITVFCLGARILGRSILGNTEFDHRWFSG